MFLDQCYAFRLLLSASGLKKASEEGDRRDIFCPVLYPPRVELAEKQQHL